MENRLWAKDCGELIKEYPFFRDGMTYEQFENEQKLYAEYLDNGVISYKYIPSFEK